MNREDLKREVTETSKNILDIVSKTDTPATAWDLKMTLKVSHTRLHLALGTLLERGLITLRPDSLTYIVETIPVSAAATVPVEATSINAAKEPIGASPEELG